MKTLKDLENTVIQRTKEKLQSEISHPSAEWEESIWLIFAEGIDWEEKSYFVERLTRRFLLKFRRNIIGINNFDDYANLLNVYHCTREDLISLVEQFVTEELPKNKNLNQEYTKRRLRNSLTTKWYDTALSDILEYSEFSSREFLTPIVYDFFDKNFQRIFEHFLKEVQSKEFEDDEDYDEGFGDMEESLKRKGWR